MTATAGSSKQVDPPLPLMSMEAEERRKLLLESLRAGYPPICEAFRMVSVNESRYITQITSVRWRERIHQSSDDSDTANDDDSDSEPPTDAHKLVIYGFDLHSEEHRRETEMIMRWNIVEREQHFPNLETSYMEKRKAKNQGKGEDVGDSQSLPLRDVAVKDCQVSPRFAKDSETSPNSIKAVYQESQAPRLESLQDVSMENSPESPKTSPTPQPPTESPKPQGSPESPVTPPETCKESSGKSTVDEPSEMDTTEIEKSSTILQETDASKEKESVPEDSGEVKSSTSEDSKHAKSSSESEMEPSGAPLRGKRKADSAAPSEGDDPGEKRTRKTSGD